MNGEAKDAESGVLYQELCRSVVIRVFIEIQLAPGKFLGSCAVWVRMLVAKAMNAVQFHKNHQLHRTA